jgi:hypothetical protein
VEAAVGSKYVASSLSRRLRSRGRGHRP